MKCLQIASKSIKINSQLLTHFSTRQKGAPTNDIGKFEGGYKKKVD